MLCFEDVLESKIFISDILAELATQIHSLIHYCSFYAREILSKKAIKVLSNRSFSNTDTATIAIKNKLFNALVKPVLLYACEIWGPKLLSHKNPFDKSRVEQVHFKFCKQSLNVPWIWYTESIACRAELGGYSLSIDIKASIFSYRQRLKHSTNNVLLREAFQYATKKHLSSTFNRMKKSIKSVK